MEGCPRNLRFAAAGIAAAGLVEILAGGQRSRLESLGRCALLGGIALAYAYMIPVGNWGLRSGAAFARLPIITVVESSAGAQRPAEFVAAGGLAGLLLRWLG
ncbi:MAG: hypothetical protein ACRD01_11860 [Terriglobales bacterium]